LCGGGPTRTTREDHVYHEGGLENVVLKNVEVVRCDACGEEIIVIPRPADLHGVIADLLVAKAEQLKGSEVHFLRKYLEVSRYRLSKLLKVDVATILNREKDG
jgi:YgiT-type zinc finger domain-containing protein